MAVDNLNFYSNGLPAGQQTDKYSSQPGCLRSKNLDIFSSSKSVKATAWTTPVNTAESGIVLVDQTGNLILKSDGGVYDRSSGTEVLVYSGVSTNLPTYNISYNGKLGTYAPAQWGTEKQLISKYENGTLKYFTIFTDRARLSYSALAYNIPTSTVTFTNISGWTAQSDPNVFHKSNTARDTVIRMRISDLQGFQNAQLIIQSHNSNYATEGYLTIKAITLSKNEYYYDAETDEVVYAYSDGTQSVEVVQQLENSSGSIAYNTVPLIPHSAGSYDLSVEFRVVPPEGSTDYSWSSGEIIITFGGYNAYYNYLGINENRALTDVGGYFWENGGAVQTFYGWESEWVDDDNRQRVVRYYLGKYMAWANDVSMDVIGMVVWNEQVYMIGNMNGNGYIIPCDLSGGRGTPFIAYGCTFRGVANIDYLMYLVGEDRGISQLWVYNGQELVAILGGNKEKSLTDYVDTAEQYKFDGKMVEYRGDLVLTTSDNRVFQYGQTFGGKGGAFIHQLPGTITELKARDNDLNVKYTASGVNYITTYQDDIIAKNYNTEWEAEYPIAIGNHLLEKEESDLYASYILPNSSCKLEFWGMANHYHFWTFKSSDSYTFSTTADYKMKGCTGNYKLKFIEKNDNYYTFRLEGDLPLQTATGMKITDTEGTELITYTEYNHFRKIGEITTDGYQEGEFRFHNLNNKLELPKSHSLQIMVRGKGTSNYTPELFAVDLVANQRDRG